MRRAYRCQPDPISTANFPAWTITARCAPGKGSRVSGASTRPKPVTRWRTRSERAARLWRAIWRTGGHRRSADAVYSRSAGARRHLASMPSEAGTWAGRLVLPAACEVCPAVSHGWSRRMELRSGRKTPREECPYCKAPPMTPGVRQYKCYTRMELGRFVRDWNCKRGEYFFRGTVRKEER